MPDTAVTSLPPCSRAKPASSAAYPSVAVSTSPWMPMASGVAASRPKGYLPVGPVVARKDARISSPVVAMPMTA